MKLLLNLYTDELRERPIPYGFSWLVMALLGTAALMLAYGEWTQQRLLALEGEHRQLQERQQSLDASIKALEAQVTKPEQQSLELELAQLHRATAQREALLAELEGQIKQPSKGFSQQLRGLSMAHGQGVWLTRIELTSIPGPADFKPHDAPSPSMEVRLSGRMHQGEQLPRYMDALAATEAFRGLRFNSMQAMRIEDDDTTLAFLLSTRANDQPENEKRR
ncbi:MAG: hypothetical protein ACP5OY_05515 [Halothiobacillaceae bacterium]|jgi:uncharacterized protein (DUF3084 family)